MSIDLRPADGGGAGTVGIWVDATPVGLARLTTRAGLSSVTVALDPAVPLRREGAAALVHAVTDRARSEGGRSVELDCDALVVRHEARQAGFAGGLRLPLRASVDEIRLPAGGTRADWARSSGPEPTSAARARARAAELADMLTGWGVPARPTRAPGTIGRLANRLALGVAGTVDVAVTWAPGRTVVLGAPDRPDLMPESLALAGDTTVAVLRRFPEQAVAIRSIRFDRSVRGLTTARYAGVADRSSGAIHLNLGYVAADAFVELVEQRALLSEHVPSVRERLTWGAGRPSARPRGPFTAVDATVAHELWHHIEGAFELSHYGDSIQLRLGLGQALGVETLERALKGAENHAPAPWQQAYRRLAHEVSPYATTNAAEATAEMFKLWWCRVGPTTPVVTRFGALVDQLIPPPPC